MKCDQNCFQCELPPDKCTGGDRLTRHKSPMPWRHTTKTTVGKGDLGMFRPSNGKRIQRRSTKEGYRPQELADK